MASPTTYLESPSASGGKFWEAWVDGATFYSRWGAVANSAGGTVTQKDFPDPEAAESHLQKQIQAKRKKGYADAVRGQVPSSNKKQGKAKDSKARTPKKRLKPKEVESTLENTSTKVYLEAPSSSGGKFWEAWVEGTTFFSRFGKVGAGGSVSPKEFETEEKAIKHLQSQIVAKGKKGYIPAEQEVLDKAGDDESGRGSDQEEGVIEGPAKKKRKTAAAKKTAGAKKKSTTAKKKK